MINNYFSYEYLSKSEIVASDYTKIKLYGIYNNFPKVIDIFCKLPYFIGQCEDPKDLKGNLQSIFYVHYVNLAYTFNVTYDLLFKGYYLESIILLRHLLEVFIQIKYFLKYPEKLSQHVLNEKRINFSVMFNEFSQGYYKKYYSKQYSEAAHGFAFKDYFRFDLINGKTHRPIIGCKYEENRATYVLNNLIPIAFGFLLYFNNVFDKSDIKTNKKVFQDYTNAKEWLEIAILEHKKQYKKSKEYYKHVYKIFY